VADENPLQAQFEQHPAFPFEPSPRLKTKQPRETLDAVEAKQVTWL
jgi:hypothetical protein